MSDSSGETALQLPTAPTAALSDEQRTFLDECETEFAYRFSDDDREFVRQRQQGTPEPPVMVPWFSRRPWQERGGWRGGRGRGGGGFRNDRDRSGGGYHDRDRSYDRDRSSGRDDRDRSGGRDYRDDRDRERGYGDSRDRGRDERRDRGDRHGQYRDGGGERRPFY